MFLFLYGDSSFLSRKRLEKIKNDFFIKNTSNANSMVFDFDEKISFGELKTAIKAEGLFSSKKIVVVKNMIKSSNKEVQDELVDYLQKNDISQDLTLVFWEEGEPKKNNKLFKEFLKKFKIERFDKLSGRSLVNWAAGEANKSGLEVEENILEKIVFFSGDDMFKIKNEIEKIINYSLGSNNSNEDMEKLIKSKLESNIFETIEAMSSKDKGKALKLFKEQVENGSDSFYILSMYIYQFRNLIKIGSFYFDGVVDRDTIVKETRLHPFVVQKSLGQLSGFTFKEIKLIYKKLEEIDIGSKSGKVNIEIEIEKLIIN
jgi:DNA polymerase-3 subunit delta